METSIYYLFVRPKMDGIPTEAEWRSEPWDLDIPHAYEHFAGKSLEEAQRLFEEDALSYQEDLMFMPLACFRYYLDAYSQYLLSDASQGDSDAASCFFGLVEVRHKDIMSCHVSARAHVHAVLDRLARSQAWFDASEDIYGSFLRRAARACKLLR